MAANIGWFSMMSFTVHLFSRLKFQGQEILAPSFSQVFNDIQVISTWFVIEEIKE